MPLSMFLACTRSLCLVSMVSIFSTLAIASDTFIASMGNGTASTFATTSWSNTQPAIPPFPSPNSFRVPCPAPPSSPLNVTAHKPVQVSSAYPPTLATSCYTTSRGTYSTTSPHKPATFIYHTTTTSYNTRSPAFPHWPTWNTSAALGAGAASTASSIANTTTAATTTSQDDSDYAIKRPAVTSSTKSPRSTKTVTLTEPVTSVTVTIYPNSPAGKNPRRRSAAAPPPGVASAAQGEPGVTVTMAFVPTTIVTVASTETVIVYTTITAMGAT